MCTFFNNRAEINCVAHLNFKFHPMYIVQDRASNIMQVCT